MLEDCIAGDRKFGLSYVDPHTTADGRPELGAVGCQTRIESVQRIPDGRSNIVCIGEVRYVLEEYLETDRMYHVARVTHFDDEPSDAADLTDLALRVSQTYAEVVAGNWTSQGARGHAPEDPKSLSMWVADALEIDPAERQHLLALRSTGQRLKRVSDHLESVRDELLSDIGSGLRSRRNGNRQRASTESSES